MVKKLNPILNSQLRLSIMSILISVESADFSFLKSKTEATSGNLSVQLEKLKEVKYIEIEKLFVAKRPKTVCKITADGTLAFEEYFKTILEYLPK